MLMSGADPLTLRWGGHRAFSRWASWEDRSRDEPRELTPHGAQGDRLQQSWLAWKRTELRGLEEGKVSPAKDLGSHQALDQARTQSLLGAPPQERSLEDT